MRISDWSSDVCSSDLVFTTRPDTLWGVTFFVFAVEHPLVTKLAEAGGTAADVKAMADALQATPLTNREQAESRAGVPPIGRASCRERVCPYVSISVVAVSLKKKDNVTTQYTTI